MKNNNKEIWSKIEGYPNYEVSSSGRVMNVKTGKILKPFISGCGYLYIELFNNNGVKSFRVHKLVAEAFIPNPEGLGTVDHIDSDKTNNNASNLQWMTQGDNARKANNKRVCQYNRNGEYIATYESVTEAAHQTRVNRVSISKCCKGYKRYSHAGGYIWRYENN